MKDKFIQAYFMRVDRESGIPYKGYLGVIENTVSAKQKYVNFGEDGGRFETVHLGHDIVIVCHEDGKLLGFPISRGWADDDGSVIDLFAGNILAVRRTGEKFTSILESDIPYIEEYLSPVALLEDGSIVRLPDEDVPEYKEQAE